LAFEVTLVEVVDREMVSAHIAGDIVGRAQLTAADDGAGCQLRLVSELSAERRVLRLVTRFAPPVARFGHDWVLDSGIRQFRTAALDRP